MIDVREIRKDPERLRQAIAMRKVDPAKANVDKWLEWDTRRRALQGEIDQINADRNKIKSLGKTDPNAAREKGQTLRKKAREVEEQLNAVSREWQAILDWFPNWPHPDMPEGRDESENRIECMWVPGKNYVESEAEMPARPCHADSGDFPIRHHLELGEKLGCIDTQQAGKVSGSRFAYLMGDLALIQYGLQNLLTGKLVEMGYCPIVPPLLVRERSLYGTSHFPEGRDQVYKIETFNIEEGNELFLVGSSEPSNFSYFMDKVLPATELPTKLFAFTTCFRSEAGSWGKDVKGIKRLHQFDKLEMNAVCSPDQSEMIYQEFREVNEWLLQTLEVPYRLVEKCGGDAGYLATHRQRDVEAWLSGTREFMEVMTDTNTSDYQARRLNIRCKSGEKGLQYCHTVNDTGCATGRLIIAILDHYQQSDGSVRVPEALRPMVGREVILPPGSK